MILAQKIQATSLLDKIDNHIKTLISKIEAAGSVSADERDKKVINEYRELNYRTKQQVQNLRTLQRHLSTDISPWASPRVDRRVHQAIASIESAFDFKENIRYQDVKTILNIKTW